MTFSEENRSMPVNIVIFLRRQNMNIVISDRTRNFAANMVRHMEDQKFWL